MARLNQQRQQYLEPKRMQTALQSLTRLGLEIVDSSDTTIRFRYKDQVIIYYPYSGWHTGKGITDGRGWEHLYNQIKNK
jgi:hypothetical protein